MQKPLNRDAIKLAAMATMACNHFAQALLPGGTLLYTVLVDIGYFTAPVMCWFLVEGFGCTRSRGRYALRLAGFALLAQAPYVLALGYGQFNMLFTLLLCFLILWALDALHGRLLCGPAVLALAFATVFCDWPLLAACYTLMFAFCRGRSRRWLGLCFVLAAGLFLLFNYSNYAFAGYPPAAALLHAAPTCLGVLAAGGTILFLYNGRRSALARRHPAAVKYFFYAFYPAHLAVLAALRLAWGA